MAYLITNNTRLRSSSWNSYYGRQAVGNDLGGGAGKANLEVFAQTLLSMALQNKDVLVVTSDSRGSGHLKGFAARLPDQIVEVGVAEQDLVAIAAGLASTGKIVYAVSPACFLTARALEQIKNDVCYSDWPVRLVGISAGVSYGPLGSTHHSLHDIAALRAINNCMIIVPADNLETEMAVRAAAGLQHPVYIRFGKRPMPHLHRPGTQFEIGKAIWVMRGSDIAFVATGEVVAQAVDAARTLKAQGIESTVVSMHTIRPLDTQALLAAASSCKAMITVEEHSIAGGLGEACAAVLMQSGIHMPFRIMGLPDEETVVGSQLEIFEHYGLSGPRLAQTALELLNGRG
ncbi:MAG: transketolase C-terminal domain-containing protein [Sedimentisphaerales bacterium]|nr:transketolase C-terminal domain-containing protein [Sedimentisphaerales bacterium]